MTHPPDEDLILFAAGALAGEDLLRVSGHLEGCAECRAAAMRGDGAASDVEEIERLIAEAEGGAFELNEISPRLADAETALAGAIAAADSPALRRLCGRVLFVDSWIQQEHGRLHAAKELNLRARRLFESIGDEVQVGRTLLGEASLQVLIGPTPRAHALVRDAIEIFTRHGEDRRVRVARAIEASLLSEVGHNREAAAIYRDLLASTPEDDPHRTYWLHDLAFSLMRQGETEEAEALELQALADPAYARTNTAIRARWSLALVLANRGSFEESIERINELIEDAGARGLQHDAMSMACSVADLLSLLGRHEEACAVLQPVVRYVAAEDLPGMAKTALALFRDAVTHQSPSLIEELDKFRNEFPHVLARPPLPLSVLASEAARRRRDEDGLRH